MPHMFLLISCEYHFRVSLNCGSDSLQKSRQFTKVATAQYDVSCVS